MSRALQDHTRKTPLDHTGTGLRRLCTQRTRRDGSPPTVPGWGFSGTPRPLREAFPALDIPIPPVLQVINSVTRPPGNRVHIPGQKTQCTPGKMPPLLPQLIKSSVDLLLFSLQIQSRTFVSIARGGGTQPVSATASTLTLLAKKPLMGAALC